MENDTGKVVLAQETYGLPAGSYFLIESYCIDKKCDCRKVMINVLAYGDMPNVSDTIGFGWEGIEFYRKWMGGDPQGCKLAGIFMEPGSARTNRSEQYFELVSNALRNPNYVNLIKKHYQSFKGILKS